MDRFCTYCSASKSRDTGTIPAIERYQSTRISRVYAASQNLGLDFFILSGKFGLVSAQREIPHYDEELTSDRVSALAELVRQQLVYTGIASIAYFARSVTKNTRLLPYSEALRIACAQASVSYLPLGLDQEIAEESAAGWKAVEKEAASARDMLIADRARGEKMFSDLEALHPGDGMVYLRRGQAYEDIEELELSAEDYKKAIVLFPMHHYKDRAKAGLQRVTRRAHYVEAHAKELEALRQQLVDSDTEEQKMTKALSTARTGIRKLQKALSERPQERWKGELLNVALEASGADERFTAILCELSLDSSLPLKLAKQLAKELMPLPRRRQRNEPPNLSTLIQRASKGRRLSDDAVYLAHLIRAQRNILAHPELDESEHVSEARGILCLFAAALLWPELPEY